MSERNHLNSHTEKRDLFISLDDAVELTGYGAHYLRRLIRSGQIAGRGSKKDLFIPWSDIERLRAASRPFWDFHLDANAPKEEFLLDPTIGTADSLDPPPNGNEPLLLPEEFATEPIATANCLDWLRRFPRGTVQTVVTSPPYWGQRRYHDERPIKWMDGESVAFGRETTVESYVRHTSEILRSLKRVLRPDGAIWWIIGDTYQTRTIVRESTIERWKNYQGKLSTTWADNPNRRTSAGHEYLKDKDLTLVPFLVAYGAQRLGFFVRSVVIWSKQHKASDTAAREPSRSHMPEPVKDRPTTGHEYIFLLSKSAKYHYDATLEEQGDVGQLEPLTNLRTVWSFPVSANHGRHTAAFPIELPERCIRLTSRPGDLVIDPFAGSGNTLIAAKRLKRLFSGCDISPRYAAEARQRLAKVRLDDPEIEPVPPA